MKYTYETSRGKKHLSLAPEEIIGLRMRAVNSPGGKVEIHEIELALLGGNTEEKRVKITELIGQPYQGNFSFAKYVYVDQEFFDSLYRSAQTLEEEKEKEAASYHGGVSSEERHRQGTDRLPDEEPLPEQPAADSPPTAALTSKPNLDKIFNSAGKTGRPPNLGKR